MTKKKIGVFTTLFSGVAVFSMLAIPAFAANNNKVHEVETVKISDSTVETKVNPTSEGKFNVEVDDSGKEADLKITVTEQYPATSNDHENQQKETARVKKSDATESVERTSKTEGNHIVEVDDSDKEADLTTTVTEQYPAASNNHENQQKETLREKKSDVSESVEHTSKTEGNYIVEKDTVTGKATVKNTK